MGDCGRKKNRICNGWTLLYDIFEPPNKDGDSEDVFLLLLIQRICYEWLLNLIL
jgi:hypothetical protein